ncbi:MAG: ribbon-helix-helix protein, CopG family [Verrucomicrobiales bacterium]|nr:ribbon-helix-helix protein, CopG family [Verrucomicrobiales bacterium]
MKSLTVRLPEAILTEIEQEARTRRLSISDIVRERLNPTERFPAKARGMRDLIGDLVGSVKGLPPDLSRHKKHYLSELIRAKKYSRR